MNKDYVKEYVKLEEHHWWFIVRQHILISLLRKHNRQKSLRILNVGAAGGASSRWLAAFGEVISLESDPYFVAYLLTKNIIVEHASVTQMPFLNDAFDLVCAFDVLEHVQDDEVAIREMERVCKIGGLICITVPSFDILWSNHDKVNGHFRRYRKLPLLQRFQVSPSLNILEIKYFNSLLFVPILLARKFSNWFGNSRSKTHSDFTKFDTGSLSNKILKAIFSLEIPLLSVINFPVGVSLFGLWKKGPKINQSQQT